MKFKLCIFTMLVWGSTNAQVLEGFENVQLDSGKVIDGSSGTSLHYFNTGEMSFPVSWDTTYKYWASGWALSKVVYNQVEPSDYKKHQYAAAPGFGVEGGKGKAFLAGQGGSSFWLNRRSPGDFPLKGFYVANSTYAYNSMKLGDFAGKKFGGSSGLDKDSFILSISYFKNGKLAGNKRVVLADFRFDDGAKDFISGEWIYVQTPDAYADSVAFALESSDNGQWGMNTPSFFVLDGIEFSGFNKTGGAERQSMHLFPVPADGFAEIVSEEIISGVLVYNSAGMLVLQGTPGSKQYKMETTNWPAGVYFVQICTANGVAQRKLQVAR